jgi:hypothetical protein
MLQRTECRAFTPAARIIFRPFLGIVDDELAEIGWRACKCLRAQIVEPRLEFGIGKSGIDGAIELVDDFRRRAPLKARKKLALENWRHPITDGVAYPRMRQRGLPDWPGSDSCQIAPHSCSFTSFSQRSIDDFHNCELMRRFRLPTLRAKRGSTE